MVVARNGQILPAALGSRMGICRPRRHRHSLFLGEEIGSGNANCANCGSRWDGTETAPVGSFAANRFGVHDMHGNLWEWVEDCYLNSYAGAPADGSPRTAGGCSDRVVRGGSWENEALFLRASYRSWGPPQT